MNFEAEGKAIGFWIFATIFGLLYVGFWATVLWLVYYAITRFS